MSFTSYYKGKDERVYRFSLFHLQCYVLFRLLTSGFKSLKIAKGGNQNPYIEDEQTTQ